MISANDDRLIAGYFGEYRGRGRKQDSNENKLEFLMMNRAEFVCVSAF